MQLNVLFRSTLRGDRGYETPKSLEPLSCATEHAEQVKAAAKSIQTMKGASKARLKWGENDAKCCGEMITVIWYKMICRAALLVAFFKEKARMILCK